MAWCLYPLAVLVVEEVNVVLSYLMGVKVMWIVEIPPLHSCRNCED